MKKKNNMILKFLASDTWGWIWIFISLCIAIFVGILIGDVILGGGTGLLVFMWLISYVQNK